MLLAIDFDGTLATHDTVDWFSARWAPDDFAAADDALARGEIGLDECLQRQIANIVASEEEITAFLVEKDWGVTFGEHEDKMGLRASPTSEVIFNNVRVPASHRIGEEGEGFKIAMHTLDRSRPTIGAQAVGIAQAAIAAATPLIEARVREECAVMAAEQSSGWMAAHMIRNKGVRHD